MSAPRVSVVVIGRNEGPRLLRCLSSVHQAHWAGVPYELIYVDSRSTDDSMRLAGENGAICLLLEDSSPCAAKARNLGWRQARGEFILFLDGDTELHADFVRHALQTLSDPKLCAVWGHRRESQPQQSIYTRVLDLDWVYPTGRTLYFGGDVMVRRAALASVDGFDPTLKAGEEPELCARLRAQGWEIEHSDVPMTRHDLAVTTFKSYWLRAWRSGIAYAEVAERMRLRGDVLWQHEAARDFRQGMALTMAPVLGLLALLWSPVMALLLVLLAFAVLVRTARRCAWKAPDQPLLCWQYALHVYVQKIPALFGQLKWRQAHRRHTEIGLVDYKSTAATEPTRSQPLKRGLMQLLVPVAKLWRELWVQRWQRVWSAACLQEATHRPLHPSNVVLGKVEVQGSGNVHLGRNALIYPGCYFETQGRGRIDIGDGVVLSRGVHIVAFDHVSLGAGTLVGEYSSLRDANHRIDPVDIRHSGHDSAPITVGNNVWIGRGAAVLEGAQLGDNCVVAANAVVTKPVPSGAVVGGVPARSLHGTGPAHPHTTKSVPQTSSPGLTEAT